MYIYTHIYKYTYIYICICMCVYACGGQDNQKEPEKAPNDKLLGGVSDICSLNTAWSRNTVDDINPALS